MYRYNVPDAESSVVSVCEKEVSGCLWISDQWRFWFNISSTPPLVVLALNLSPPLAFTAPYRSLSSRTQPIPAQPTPHDTTHAPRASRRTLTHMRLSPLSPSTSSYL
jgi:hypothetical protein